MAEASLAVRDIPIHYEVYGEGRPVVLLHGFSLDHRVTTHTWEPIFTARADRSGSTAWRRIYPDMPGHGATPAPAWLATDDEMLDLLVEFVEAVTGGERLVAIGASWGAYMAYGLANRMVERIDGLMLEIPLLHADRGSRDLPPRTIIVDDPTAVADIRPGEEIWEEIAVIRTHEALARFRQPEGGLPPDEAFLERLAPHYAFSFEDDLVARVEAPALVLAGRQDSVVGYRDAWKRLEHMPRATFAVLDRAGHLLGDEQPELLTVLANEWLDRVEEWIAR